MMIQKESEKLINDFYEIAGMPPNLRLITEFYRIKIFSNSLPEKVSGCVLDILGNRCIVINKDKPYYHRRFTVAHEFFHYFFDKETAFRLCFDIERTNDIQERRANIFAAKLLMPDIVIRNCYNSGWRSIKEYCKFFRVSQQAMHIRFLELGYCINEFLML